MRTRKRLGPITRFFLVKRGKKDAKRGIICFDETKVNSLTSPFFKEEISLCLNLIHKENEKYNIKRKKTLHKQKRLENKKNKIDIELSTLLNEIEFQMQIFDELSKKEYDFDDYLTSPIIQQEDTAPFFPENKELNQICLKLEKQARFEVEKYSDKNKKSAVENSISKQPIKIKALEQDLKRLNVIQLQEKEKLEIQFDMMVERCKQHYSFTVARISAYWSGVLQKIDNIEFSHQFHLLDIFKSLQNELKEIKSLRKGEE